MKVVAVLDEVHTYLKLNEHLYYEHAIYLRVAANLYIPLVQVEEVYEYPISRF